MVKAKNITNFLLTKNKNWVSSWHLTKNDYNSILQDDLFLLSYTRSIVYYYCKNFELLCLRLYRNNNNVFVNVFLTVIKKFDKLFFDNFSKNVNKFFNYKKKIFLFVQKQSNMVCSSYIALKIAKFLEKRVKLKSKVIKTFLDKVACYSLGLKIQCSGRLNNVDIAKTVSMCFGLVPLQSVNLDVDFDFIIANTNIGLQSIKVWFLHK